MSSGSRRLALVGWALLFGLVAGGGAGAQDVAAITARVTVRSVGGEALDPGHATVVRVDAESGEVLAVYPAGPAPFLLCVAAGHVWTMNFGDHTLTHVDPAMEVARTIDVGEVAGVACDGDDVWVTRDGNVLARLNGATGAEETALRLGGERLFAPDDGGFIGVAGGSLWLTVPHGGPQELWRIDPRTGDVLSVIPIGPAPWPPFAYGGYLWIVTHGDERLTRIDIDTLDAVRVPVDSFPWSVAGGDGTLWIGHQVVPKVRRFDPETFEVSAELRFQTNPRGLAFGGGALWVATENSLNAVDPETDEVTLTVEFGPFPSDTGPIGVAYLDGDVWVSIE